MLKRTVSAQRAKKVSKMGARRIEKTKSAPSAATRESLTVSAIELFASKNYSSVTIKDISHVTKLNSALIYYYFGSKEGLFLAAVDYAVDKAVSAFRDLHISDVTPEKTIENWIKNHKTQFFLMRKLLKMSLDYALVTPEETKIKNAIRRFYDVERRLLVNCIKAGIESGKFAPTLKPERMAQFISTFLDGVLVRSYLMSDFSYEKSIDDLIEQTKAQLHSR